MVMLTGSLAVAAAMGPDVAIEKAIGYLGKERQQIRGINERGHVYFINTLPFLGEWFSLRFNDGKASFITYRYVCSPRSGILWTLNRWKEYLSTSKRWKFVESYEVEEDDNTASLYSDGKYFIEILNEEMGPYSAGEWTIMVSIYSFASLMNK
jgi:hypothetical protein